MAVSTGTPTPVGDDIVTTAWPASLKSFALSAATDNPGKAGMGTPVRYQSLRSPLPSGPPQAGPAWRVGELRAEQRSGVR